MRIASNSRSSCVTGLPAMALREGVIGDFIDRSLNNY